MNVVSNYVQMYKFTQTGMYYNHALHMILNMYPGIFCIPIDYIYWSKNSDIMQYKDLVNGYIKNCNKNFVFFKLNINNAHANYLLVTKNTNTILRYEPHGYVNSNTRLDSELEKLCKSINFTYISPEKECPYLGIQTQADDTMGLCQTSVLYSLLNRLDSSKYPFDFRKKNTIAFARKELKKVAVMVLCDIYKRLPDDLKTIFLMYNFIDVFSKEIIDTFIIKNIIST